MVNVSNDACFLNSVRNCLHFEKCDVLRILRIHLDAFPIPWVGMWLAEFAKKIFIE